jgi:C1A family cysteine protease
VRKNRYFLGKKGCTLMLAAALLALPSFPATGSAADQKAKIKTDPVQLYATGLKPSTLEEQQWFEQHASPAKNVKLSKLGKERVNHARKAKGLSPIDDNLGADAGVLAEAGASVAQIDNSTLKYFPPIANQSSLGSCVSFASTYYMGTYMTAMAREWDAKNGGDSFRLSPTWTYNFLNGGGNNGTSIEGTLQLLMNNGATTWADIPYNTTDYLSWSTNPQIWRNALANKFASTGTISNTDTEDGLTNIKQFLLNGYILEYATGIYSWQFTSVKDDSATSLDDAFVGQTAASYVNGYEGGHAMTVVGYDDNVWIDINGNGVVDTGEKGALKIANSWGTGWGNRGFVWLAYDALKGVSTVPGANLPNKKPAFSYGGNLAYWITAHTSYTPRLTAEITVNTAKRNELSTVLGYSEPNNNSQINTITPKALENNGGAYAFDGSTNAVDGTFVLDYTDLISQSDLDVNHDYNWYLTAKDNVNDDASLTIKSFSLRDNLTNTVIASSYGYPGTANGTSFVDAISVNLAPSDPVFNTIDDTARAIAYNTAWSKYNSDRDYGGSESYTSTAGNYAQYTFNGTSIRYIGMKQPNMGKVDVYLDGVLAQADIDCYSPTMIKQAVIFSASGLTDGAHTIKVVAKGTKNPASSNSVAAIDAFQYLGSGSESGALYEAENATVNHANIVSGTGASSGRYVAQIDFSDSYVDFNVNASTAGTYDMDIRYANGTGATSTHNMSVNGGPSQEVSYPVTNGWGQFGTLRVNVSLNAGSNTIRLAKGSTGYAELDYIQLAPQMEAVNIAPQGTASTSYVSPWESLSGLGDGYEPLSSSDRGHPVYGNWNNPGSTQWVQYTFGTNKTISRTEVYWFDDNQGLDLPASYTIQYWNGTAWEEVSNPSGLGVLGNQYNVTTFTPVMTDRIRININAKPNFSTGIEQWKVFGY